MVFGYGCILALYGPARNFDRQPNAIRRYAVMADAEATEKLPAQVIARIPEAVEPLGFVCLLLQLRQSLGGAAVGFSLGKEEAPEPAPGMSKRGSEDQPGQMNFPNKWLHGW